MVMDAATMDCASCGDCRDRIWVDITEYMQYYIRLSPSTHRKFNNRHMHWTNITARQHEAISRIIRENHPLKESSLMPGKGARMLIVNTRAERYFAPCARLLRSIRQKMD